MANLTSLAKSKLREAQYRSTDMIDEAGDAFNSIYNQSQKWLKKNYGKTLGGVAIVAAIGVLGYFVGKTLSESIDDTD